MASINGTTVASLKPLNSAAIVWDLRHSRRLPTMRTGELMSWTRKGMALITKPLVSAPAARAMRNWTFVIFAVVGAFGLPSALSARVGDEATCPATYQGCAVAANCPSCSGMCASQCEGYHWNGINEFCSSGLGGSCDPVCTDFAESCWHRSCTCIPNEPE